MTEEISVRDRIRSYSAGVMIFIMMLLVLRNLKLGPIHMVPNLLPIIITLGLVGIMKIPLDFATLLIACIAIGIAWTIRFISDSIQAVFPEISPLWLSPRNELNNIWKSNALYDLILCAGFLMFAPSDMVSIARFGMLVAHTRSRAGCRLLCDAVADVPVSLGKEAIFRGAVAYDNSEIDHSAAAPRTH